MLQKANVVRGPIKLEVLRGPQQNDDHNCGVYALLWAHKWVYQLAHPDEFSEVYCLFGQRLNFIELSCREKRRNFVKNSPTA